MTNDSLASLIQSHIERYPEMELTDVYKLLHQATFGSGTPDVNKKIEREWLESEYRIYKPNPNLPLMESVSPDGRWVRLHLRPYMAAGGKIDPLVDTFVVSVKQVQLNNGAQLTAWWQAFEQLAQTRWSFPLDELQIFGKIHAGLRWPAIAHSPKFVRTYQPLYRVLVSDLAVQLCQKQNIPVRA